nr:unnamed protein product [Spirometra erinaceieuropaei]
MAESHVKPTSRTLLNGEPVVSRTFVPHNSTLTVGERNFKFLYPENSTWTSTFRQSPRSTKADTRFRSATTPVVDVESFPVVRSKSPKPSVPQPFVKRTPTASPSRRPLTTRERYGPTPPRPITPAPVVEVKRHESRSALKARHSSAGSRHTPTSPSLSRKKAHVLLLTNTSTSGPQSIRRHARQQKTPASTQANNSSITSSYSALGLKSPNYSNESAYTSAFLNDPSYDVSYNPSSADALSPAAEYFSLQKKGDFAPYAKFPFTEPRQRTFANRTPISRRKSLPRSRPMLPTKGSDSSTPIPTRSRSSSSPASSLVSTPARNLATLPAPSPNNAASFRLHRSPNSIPSSPRPSRTSVLSTDGASLVNMPRVASPSPRGTAKTPLTDKSRVRARSIVSSTKVSKSQREVSLGGGERRSLSLGRPSLVSASKDSSEGDVNVNQIPKSKSKAVKFGPALSPEQFDSRLPPSTPVRRGAVPLMHSFRGRTSVVSSHPQHNGGPTEVANSDVSISSSPAYVSGKRLSTQRQSTTTNNMPSSLETRRSLSAPPSVVQFKSPARSKDIATPSSPWTGNRKSTLPVSSPVHQRRSVLSLGETHIKTDLPMSPNVKSNLRTSGVNKSQDSLRELSAYDLVSPTQTLTESPRALLPERNSGLRTPAQHVPKRLSASSSLKRTSNPDAGRESVSTAKLPRLSGRRAVRASPTPRKPLRTSSPAVSEPRVSGKLSEVSRVHGGCAGVTEDAGTEANSKDVGHSETHQDTEIATFSTANRCPRANEDTDDRAHVENLFRSQTRPDTGITAFITVDEFSGSEDTNTKVDPEVVRYSKACKNTEVATISAANGCSEATKDSGVETNSEAVGRSEAH